MIATISSLGIARNYRFRADAPVGRPMREWYDTLTIPQLQGQIERALDAMVGQGEYRERRIDSFTHPQMFERILYMQTNIDLIRERMRTMAKHARLEQQCGYWLVHVYQGRFHVMSKDVPNRSLAISWVSQHHPDVVKIAG